MDEIQLSYVMVRQRGITWEKTPWKRITKPASNVPVSELISSVLPQVWIALWHETTEVLVQVVKLLGLVLGFGTTASRSQHVASVGEWKEPRIAPSGRTAGPAILQLSRYAIYGAGIPDVSVGQNYQYDRHCLRCLGRCRVVFRFSMILHWFDQKCQV